MNNLNFSCFHNKESLFTNRLYVGVNQNESEIKDKVFSNGKERKGLGMTEYVNILGRFLNFIGLAFKTKDKDGNDLYINKKSFCNLIYRLQKNNQTHDYLDIDFVEAEYKAKKDHQTKQCLERIYKRFNIIFPTLSNKNIGELSSEILNRV